MLHKCCLGAVDEVGLREMRQNATELVRRAQAGEQLTITVSGHGATVHTAIPRTSPDSTT